MSHHEECCEWATGRSGFFWKGAFFDIVSRMLQPDFVDIANGYPCSVISPGITSARSAWMFSLFFFTFHVQLARCSQMWRRKKTWNGNASCHPGDGHSLCIRGNRSVTLLIVLVELGCSRFSTVDRCTPITSRPSRWWGSTGIDWIHPVSPDETSFF